MAFRLWKAGEEMIKLITFKTEDTNIQITYTPDVRTYNVVSGLMNDECKPFKIAQSAMMWVNDKGYLGEI